jgi:hypothetical protein
VLGWAAKELAGFAGRDRKHARALRMTVQNMKNAFERYTELIAEETTFTVISPSCDELE